MVHFGPLDLHIKRWVIPEFLESRHPTHREKITIDVGDLLKIDYVVCKTMRQSFPPCGNVIHQGEHRHLA